MTPSSVRTPLVTLIATSVLVACTADGGGEGATPRYLFDLDEQEIVDAVEYYQPGADPSRVLTQLEAPFRCDRFPGACETHGAENAEEILAQVWSGAREHQPADELAASVAPRLAPAPALPGPGLPVSFPSLLRTSGEDHLLCPQLPFFVNSVTWTASMSDFGILVGASASYTSTRNGGDLVVLATDNPIDADLEIELSDASDLVIASDADAFVSAAEGSVSLARVSTSPSHSLTATLTTDSLFGVGVVCDNQAVVELAL